MMRVGYRFCLFLSTGVLTSSMRSAVPHNLKKMKNLSVCVLVLIRAVSREHTGTHEEVCMSMCVCVLCRRSGG